MTPIIPKKRKAKPMAEPTADVLVINLVGQILQAKERLQDSPDERINKMAEHALSLVMGDQELITRLLVHVMTQAQNQRQPNPFLQQLIEKKQASQPAAQAENPELTAVAKQLLEQLKGASGGSGTTTPAASVSAGTTAAAT